ncbi:hypothetical protein [Vibrio phage RYC]|nr:hypothetical protein [Vibrio phage RYC]
MDIKFKVGDYISSQDLKANMEAVLGAQYPFANVDSFGKVLDGRFKYLELFEHEIGSIEWCATRGLEAGGEFGRNIYDLLVSPYEKVPFTGKDIQLYIGDELILETKLRVKYPLPYQGGNWINLDNCSEWQKEFMIRKLPKRSRDTFIKFRAAVLGRDGLFYGAQLVTRSDLEITFNDIFVEEVV